MTRSCRGKIKTLDTKKIHSCPPAKTMKAASRDAASKRMEAQDMEILRFL